MTNMAAMTETQRLTLVLDRARGMNTAEIVESEVDEFRRFAQPRLLEAEAYYRNRSAVQRKTARYESRSNTKIEHSLLRKLVDQKVNYLLAKPFTISSKSAAYEKALNGVFDARARAEVKSLGKEAIKKGIGWVQLYIGEEGTLRLKRLPTEQILPEWADDEHTRLDCHTGRVCASRPGGRGHPEGVRRPEPRAAAGGTGRTGASTRRSPTRAGRRSYWSGRSCGARRACEG